MGNLYLSSNESIILSTNNVVVNSVQAEAVLTNERLMLFDARHAELRPQDIPFHAIETVTIGEDSNQDPMLFLSLVTAPGVTQALGIAFPQPPKTKRAAERNEWANRLKELSTVSIREGGTTPMKILPPWVPGELPPEEDRETTPAAVSDAASQFRNPPLAPRKPRASAASKNRTMIAAAVVVVIVVVVAVMAYLVAPSLFGRGTTPLPPVTIALTTTMTTVPTPVPTTIATLPPTTPVTAIPTTIAAVAVPQTGVWIKVTYAGSFTGSAGAPGRFRDISDNGDHVYQLAVKDEIVTASIQKQDNSGNKLTVGIYSQGQLVKSGSVTAPKGTVNIAADLRNP
jgi:hypothetical protein